MPFDSVYVAREQKVDYASRLEGEETTSAGQHEQPVAEALLCRLFRFAGADKIGYGTPHWNPLSGVIRPGDKVVIKPNWVYHRNNAGHGMDCLVTHTSVIEAILKYAVRANPMQIVIGDAPVQGCDFEALCAAIGIRDAAARFSGSGVPVEVRDFRMTRRTDEGFAAPSKSTGRSSDACVEFDLGPASWLEEITQDDTEFRVTMYDPDALKRTHRCGSHRYLVAREVMEADVIISVPKLKTHKKACVTGALKNVVGINVLKDYLPHHRKGGSARGGDCYEGDGVLKAMAEDLTDAGNRAGGRWLRGLYGSAAAVCCRLSKMQGGDGDLEGSWFGNDTIWRTTLDLQRLLIYGTLDGRLNDSRQRRVLNITDAIVAGEGEGPLYPSPVPLGVLTMGNDACAVEWVHAILMGFDPGRIPLLQHALGASPHEELAEFRVNLEGRWMSLDDLAMEVWPAFRAPEGWRGHCERGDANSGAVTAAGFRRSVGA